MREWYCILDPFERERNCLEKMMNQAEGFQAHVLMQQPSNKQINLFEEGLYGAGSDIIRSELGAYGERLIGSGSAFVQSNVSELIVKATLNFFV